MPGPARILALEVLLSATSLTGCTSLRQLPEQEPEDFVTLTPIAPSSTQLKVEPGANQTFVVECQNEGVPERVWASSEHAINGGEIVDAHRQHYTTGDPSEFTTRFDRVTEHVVTISCTTESDRSEVRAWTMTVEETGSGNESKNDSGTAASGNGSASRPAS
jgi:hypothetical protein